jgi:hypothetical protein
VDSGRYARDTGHHAVDEVNAVVRFLVGIGERLPHRRVDEQAEVRVVELHGVDASVAQSQNLFM